MGRAGARRTPSAGVHGRQQHLVAHPSPGGPSFHAVTCACATPSRLAGRVARVLPRTRMWAIETEGLTRLFDGKPAVQGLALRVPAGSFYGFLGPNGAGK